MMAERYVPPHSRKAQNGQNQQENEQRSLDELAQALPEELFIVKLKSDKKYSDIPFKELPIDVQDKDSENAAEYQQFQFPLGYMNLRELMKWFRKIGWKDPDAVLEFPLELKKEQRKLVHETAQSFGLGTSSQGFGNNRYISVYSVEKATLGVGKVHLTQEERKKADEIWQLIKQEDKEEFKKFSHNEIEEMILVNKLDPRLQELWDKKQSLLVDDVKKKCKVADE